MGEHAFLEQNTIEPGYNDIALYDTLSITSDIMLYQLIRNNIILLDYNDIYF
jgi:hypothetical protein